MYRGTGAPTAAAASAGAYTPMADILANFVAAQQVRAATGIWNTSGWTVEEAAAHAGYVNPMLGPVTITAAELAAKLGTKTAAQIAAESAAYIAAKAAAAAAAAAPSTVLTPPVVSSPFTSTVLTPVPLPVAPSYTYYNVSGQPYTNEDISVWYNAAEKQWYQGTKSGVVTRISAPPFTVTSDMTGGGFDLASIPWWVWVGAAYFILK